MMATPSERIPRPAKPVDHGRAVLLASGGMDSTVLAYWLERREVPVRPLFIDYGQHNSEVELETLARTLPRCFAGQVHTARLATVFSGSRSRLLHEANLWTEDVTADDLFLPYRNLFLLAAGAAYAASHGFTELYAAFINSNHAREIDATRVFLDSLSSFFSSAGAVGIHMPFRDYSKEEVARLGLGLDAPIALTYSCQIASRVHCGACPNCVDRLAAFRALSIAVGGAGPLRS
jgi:7-cyano-7-deazaguanine synthase